MEVDSHNERKLAETPSVKTKKKTPRNTPKKTPKRSARLNQTPDQQRKQENYVVFYLGSKAPPLIRPTVIKAAASRKLVLQKNTRLAAQERKNSSAAIKMFSVIVENFLQKEILIEHDESLLTNDVCQVIIDFAALRNEVIDL